MSIKNKLWYKLEMYVAKILGLKRIGFSGGIWPNKEDAQDVNFICQCKATEGKQIVIKGIDLRDLYKRSIIQHKLPLFVIHIDTVEYEEPKTWIAMTLEDFDDLGIKDRL